jgi:hypothetical protein
MVVGHFLLLKYAARVALSSVGGIHLLARVWIKPTTFSFS